MPSYGAQAPQQSDVPMPQNDAAAGAQGYVVPFTRAAKQAVYAGQKLNQTLSTAAQSMPHTIPMVGGWNRWISLLIEAVTAGNSANVAFQTDAPYNLIQQVLLKDAGQKSLYMLQGYRAYLSEYLGGYHLFDIAAGSGINLGTTGTGATGGSFKYMLNIYAEFGRDGIGSYPNMDSSRRLNLDLTLAPSTDVYSTAPTNQPTIYVTPIVHYYTRPGQVDANGRAQRDEPQGRGTIQFWRELSQTVDNGANVKEFTLSGRYIRNAWLLFLNTSDVRSNTVRPTDIRIELDNTPLYDGPVDDIIMNTYAYFGRNMPTGLVPLLLGTLDPDGSAGREWGDDWWSTATSSQLRLKFTAGAAGKVFLILNEVEPVGAIFR
jgi:hypothetical protein